MLHARIARFDVIATVALFRNLGWELNTRYGVVRWVLRSVDYEADANPPEDIDTLQAISIVDGFVYLVTSEMVLALCLETMKLEKLFPRSFRARHFHPYIMAWPPSLVGNYGSFALIQDGVDNVSN